MKFAISAALGLALAAGAAGGALAATEIQWWHAMAGANNEVVEALVQGIQREPERLQGHAGLQGHLSGSAAGRHRRFPRRPAAAHPAGVRCRHRRDDGRRRRHRSGRRGDGEGRRAPSTRASTCRASSPIIPGRTGRCCPSPTTAPRRSPTTTRTSSRRPGLDPNNPPKTWPEVWDAARKIVSSGAAPCGYTSAWLTWIHTGELRRLEQPSLCDEGERPRRHRMWSC